MMDSPDDFNKVTANTFGQMEAQVGTELYHSNVKVQESLVACNIAQSALLAAQAEVVLNRAKGDPDGKHGVKWSALSGMYLATLCYLIPFYIVCLVLLVRHLW